MNTQNKSQKDTISQMKKHNLNQNEKQNVKDEDFNWEERSESEDETTKKGTGLEQGKVEKDRPTKLKDIFDYVKPAPKKKKIERKPEASKESASGMQKPVFTSNKPQNKGGRPMTTTTTTTSTQEKAPQFVNPNRKDLPKKEFAAEPEFKKQEFKGKIEAKTTTSSNVQSVPKKDYTEGTTELKYKQVVVDENLEKPSFAVKDHKGFVDLDKDSDLFLKNMAKRGPEEEIKYSTQRKHSQEKDRKPKRTYNKPKKDEDEPFVDSDGFVEKKSKVQHHYSSQNKGYYKKDFNRKDKENYGKDKVEEEAKNKEESRPKPTEMKVVVKTDPKVKSLKDLF